MDSCRRRRGLAAIAAGLFVLALAGPAAATSPTVAAARAAYDRATFDTAVTLFNDALRDPRSTPADLVEAHRHLATLALAAGDGEDAAARHVELALALDPAAQPAAGSPPEVESLFRRVRTERRGARLLLSFRALSSPQPQRGFRLGARVSGAPEGWSFTLAARCDRAGTPVAETEAREAALALPMPALPGRTELACEARVLSPEGVPVARTRLDLVVPAAGPNVPLAVGLGVSAGVVVVGAVATVLIWSAVTARAELGPPMYITPGSP